MMDNIEIIRHMIDQRIANQIGPSGCWLMTVLAISGDGLRWDDEVAALAGFGSRSTLHRVREACVKAGLVEYTPGTKGRPANYRILTGFCIKSVMNVTQNVDSIRTECDTESEQKVTEKPQSKKRQPVVATVEDPPIPHEFDIPAFRDAWSRWLEYRRQRKAVSRLAATRQFSTLLGWVATGATIADLVDSIDQSIANDWQGLFEARKSGGGRKDVVDRKALAKFLEGTDGIGSSEVCEGHGIPAGGGTGVGGGGDPQCVLAPPAGSGPGAVRAGDSGSGGEPQVPHPASGSRNQAARGKRSTRPPAYVGRELPFGQSSGSDGRRDVCDGGNQGGGTGNASGAGPGVGVEMVDDDLPF